MIIIIHKYITKYIYIFVSIDILILSIYCDTILLKVEVFNMIYKGDIKDIIKTIEHIKVDKDISNRDIAERMGKSKQTISNLLNGRQPNLTLETLLSLCNAIDCDLVIDIQERD